ncbi:hypothetical protein GBW32_23670 [Streptomyces tsukubensis]|nr:hypothetical protein GBW32_23670 [Streptomyces tsukubensis]
MELLTSALRRGPPSESPLRPAGTGVAPSPVRLGRATSVLLAVMAQVPEFGRRLTEDGLGVKQWHPAEVPRSAPLCPWQPPEPRMADNEGHEGRSYPRPRHPGQQRPGQRPPAGTS